MQSSLVQIIDTVSIPNGTIKIKALSEAKIKSLSTKIIWAFSDTRSPSEEIAFGGTFFRPEKAAKGVVIDTGSLHFDFEIKSIMLLLYHSGTKEGGITYKWRTVAQRVRTLCRFASFCTSRKIYSFRNLNDVPALKMKTMLIEFVTWSHDRGGLNGGAISSSFKLALDSLKHLSDYIFQENHSFLDLLRSVTLANINRHEDEERLRHPIIPTKVMKQLISESVTYINQAQKNFSEFKGLFELTLNLLRNSSWDNGRQIGYLRNKKLSLLYNKLFDDSFKDLQRHVYVLILIFTGMRDSEVGGLRTDCMHKKSEHGEQIYYLKGLLQKTDDQEIMLDWICNDIAYEAVKFLSQVNSLYYERAEILIAKYSHSLSDQMLNEMQHGLNNRLLFGLRFSLASASFNLYTKASDGIRSLQLKKYRIAVDDADISQLDHMECNYQSVCRTSGLRGKRYVEGDYFNFSSHQFRHTFAWFIIANRLGDLDDIKYQFKHLTRAMSLIYSERGYQSMNELVASIDFFENFMNEKAVEDIVASAHKGSIAGGGGERLTKLLGSLNGDVDEQIYGNDLQPHFGNVSELSAYATRHGTSIRGLPHGYCTKGQACKIKNAADPSHCLYCETYYATPKHLPYWQIIRNNCASKIAMIEKMPATQQKQLRAFKQSLDDNLFAAEKVIYQLSAPASGIEEQA